MSNILMRGTFSRFYTHKIHNLFKSLYRLINCVDMKVQSAMEYLMTYGWSILIIAVVIASLIELGVFNSSSTSTSACIGTTGYSCTHPTLYSSGTLIVGLGQVGTQPIDVIGTSCTNSSSPGAIAPISTLQVQSEQQVQLVFRCPLKSTSTGTQFTGHLWIEYNTSTAHNLIQEIGTVITPVISSNESSYAPIAYISSDSKIVAVNLNTYEVVNTLNIPGPYYEAGYTSIALSPDGKYAYSSPDPLSGYFDKINLTTFTIANQISLGVSNGQLPQYIGMSPDGSYAYVYSPGESTFYSINLNSNTVTNTISLPITNVDYGALSISSDGQYAYLANDGNIFTINLLTDSISNTISFVPSVAIDALQLTGDGQTAYACGSAFADYVYKINLQTGSVSNVLYVTPYGPNGPYIDLTDANYYNQGCSIAYSSYNNHIYIAGAMTSMLYSFNITSNTVYAAMPINIPQAIALSPNGQYAYIPTENGALETVDVATNTVANITDGVGGLSIELYNPST